MAILPRFSSVAIGAQVKMRRGHIPAMVLLLIHLTLLAYSAWVHAPVMDELAHLAAGLSHWEFGRFDLYRVNPPLVRLVAALPMLCVRPQTDWSRYSAVDGARAEFNVGDDFVTANGPRSFILFALARWTTMPFSLLGGWVCYRWARELYGEEASLAALALWCFSPNVMAYGALIIPDAGAASMGVWATYLFWRWLREPTWRHASAAGVVMGLAELTKSTWLVLFVVLPALAGLWRRCRPPMLPNCRIPDGSDRSRQGQRSWGIQLRWPVQLGIMLLFAVFVINVGYGFEATGRRIRDFSFVSHLFTGDRALEPRAAGTGNRFANSWLGAMRIPLPANYVSGIDVQRHDFEFGMASYLRGQWRKGGWWYYYLFALVIKAPLGTWVLVLLAAAQRLRFISNCKTWRDELVLLTPCAAVLLLVSSQTGFSRYLRYVLPIAPYVFIWVSGVFRPVRRPCLVAKHAPERATTASTATWPSVAKRNIIGLFGLTALAWSIASSLWYYPHSMSYFNELVGGPRGGHAHLIDANIDWGQDLLYLRHWVDAHPEARRLRLAYFGLVDPNLAGIEYTLPPKGRVVGDGAAARSVPPTNLPAGWYAVSVNFLHGYPHRAPDGHGSVEFLDRPYYAYFLNLEPSAIVGYSIYIYHVSTASTGGEGNACCVSSGDAACGSFPKNVAIRIGIVQNCAGSVPIAKPPEA